MAVLIFVQTPLDPMSVVVGVDTDSAAIDDRVMVCASNKSHQDYNSVICVFCSAWMPSCCTTG